MHRPWMTQVSNANPQIRQSTLDDAGLQLRSTDPSIGLGRPNKRPEVASEEQNHAADAEYQDEEVEGGGPTDVGG